MRPFYHRFVIPAVLLLGVLWGCRGQDVLPLRDEEAIIQYLAETEEGRDLFRVADLIPSSPYRLPYDSAVYTDFVDSATRTYDVATDSLLHDFGALGELYTATATAVDLLFVTTFRVSGNDTTTLSSERRVERYGYFIKLGDDTKPYLGWKLWGFNSLGQSESPVDLSVTTADGTQALAASMAGYTYNAPGASLSFVRLSDINDLANGDTLLFSVSPQPGISVAYFHLITVLTDSGFVSQVMDRVDDQHWVDTVVMPSPNLRLWNIVFVQSFLPPPSFQYIRGWCVPYRVPQ